MHHPHEERLQDYVDDLLCGEERAELEGHLAACAACAEEIRRTRELQHALRELPRELAAPAGLRAAINARIDEQPLREAPADAGMAPPEAGRRAIGGGAPERRVPLLDRPLRALRPALAAAALLLVALSTALTLLLVRESGPAVATVPAAGTPRMLLAVERPYQREADQLNAVLTAGREVLAPGTVRILEENLRVIDAALGEAREALREDPGNAAVLALLRATHERRLDLLRQATRWSQGT